MAAATSVKAQDDDLTVPTKADVTYIPQHKDDPSEVIWHKILFRANVPKVGITNQQLLRSAMTNTHFEVNGKKKEKVKPGAPETAEGYRLHAITWINAAETHHALVKQWEGEQEMRDEIGVGTDDLDYILPQYNARFAKLKKQQEADK